MQSLKRKTMLWEDAKRSAELDRQRAAAARTGQVVRSTVDVYGEPTQLEQMFEEASDTAALTSDQEDAIFVLDEDQASGLDHFLDGDGSDIEDVLDAGELGMENTEADADRWAEYDDSVVDAHGSGMDAIEAWDKSEFATTLAKQLETELGEAKVELDQALEDAAQALSDAGLAKSAAAQAVADAQAAAVEAGAAIEAAQDAARDAANAAVEAELAAGKLTVSDRAPVAGDGAGKPVGALWLRRAAGVEAIWEWTALGWVPRPLAETIIPKVAIGAGTYGELDGERIVANEGLLRNLYANRIVVSTSDFAPGPGGYEAAWTLGASASFSTNDSLDPSGKGIMISRDGSDDDRTAVGPKLPVSAATSVKVGLRGTYTGTSNTGEWRAEMRWFDRSGNPLPASVVHQASANVTVENTVVAPAGTVAGQLALWVAARPSGASGNRIFRTISARAMTGGELIVDGAILADKLAANAVTATKIAAEAVTAAKLAANAVIAEKIAAGAITTDKLFALSVTAEKIAVGAIIAEKIAAGAITTAHLAATAIDGMTITGALIRTAPSGQRIELDVNGLRGFSSSGTQTARISADSGGLALVGPLTSYEGGNNPRASLNAGGLFLDLPGSPAAGSIQLTAEGLTSFDSSSRVTIEKQSSAMGTGVTLRAGSSPSKTAAIHVNGSADGGAIVLGAARVTFQGDTDWVRLDGWNGGFAHSSSPVFYRRSRGYVEFRGYLTNGSWSGGWASFGASMPPGFRPVDAVFGMPGNSTVVRAIRFDNTGALQLYGNVNSGAWWNFAQIRYPAEA